MEGITNRFKFDPIKHAYTLDGRRLYGTTSVLNVISKPALIQWSADMTAGHLGWLNPKKESAGACLKAATTALASLQTHTPESLHQMLSDARVAHCKKKDDAASKGTDVHAEIESFINSCLTEYNGISAAPNTDVVYSEQAHKFIGWAIENNIIFLVSEQQLYSESMWLAGTCDFKFIKDGKRYVGDLKTTSGIYDRTPFFQVAAYELMSLEHGEDPFDGGRCIVRCGKDGSFEVVYSNSPADKEGFLAALALFKALEVPITEKQTHIKNAIRKSKNKN